MTPTLILMVFESGRRRLQNVPTVTINNCVLQRVSKFKYLGHVLLPDLKDNGDIERERRALSVRANMLARRFVRCSHDVKVTLFRAYCTNFYTCSLWASFTRQTYNSLRVQYNNAFRMLLGLLRFCSASRMFAEARVDCFFATMRKRCASLVRRVRGSSSNILRMIVERMECPYLRHCSDISAGLCT
ncbi:uncharacterized protein LOC125051274 [Pieris napi]|uniref:uncharacterized protein LOC125051274 n=1 Tax=Pieris napi TaxID=78633 RepID=UPI001FBB3F22|nr:uncharacterized protein LOC125051274 [Pieris napi]